MHAGMGGFQLFAVVPSRPTRGKDDKLDEMFFEIGDVLLGRVPSGGATAVNGKAPALDALALPIDPRVLQHPGRKVSHDIRDARLAAEAIKERQLTFNARRFIGR